MRTDVALLQCHHLRKHIHAPNKTLAIAHIKKALKEAGLSCTIVESIQGGPKERVDGILDQLRTCNPRAIGISSTSKLWKNVRALARIIKREFPEVPIVAGGYICLYPGIMQIADIDVLFRGEGELRAPALFRALISDQDIRGIPGLLIRENGRIIDTGDVPERLDDLDRFVPDHDDVIVRAKPSDMDIAYVYASRGCQMKCGFCCIRDMLGREVREVTTKKLSQVIEELAQKGVRRISFLDDNFLYRPGRLYEIADALRRTGIKIYFQSRVSDVLKNKKEISECKDVLLHVEMGTESFSGSQLRRFRKCTTVEANWEAVQFLHGERIQYCCYLILLDSGVTQDELKENVEAILTLPDSVQSSEESDYFDTPYYCGPGIGHYFFHNVLRDKLDRHSLDKGQTRFKDIMSMIEMSKFDNEITLATLGIVCDRHSRELGLRHVFTTQVVAMSMFILAVESVTDPQAFETARDLYDGYYYLKEDMNAEEPTQEIFERAERIMGRLEEIGMPIIDKAEANGWKTQPIRKYV